MTGAARGPGLAFAKVLAENRANLAVLDIVPPDQPLERMKTDYGMRVTTLLERGVLNAKSAESDSISAAEAVTDVHFLTTSDKNLSSLFAVNSSQALSS
ncbi:hypothetical protein HO173_011112 [Letharia columbiana]|uniref:Uncharacterized protein n=1 Tax=Letharia columbiana TaxID=112416 RepID=A0A8H6FL64_9LECA|nr:uncharacterized protein HO173_011112 [Letharia columbiana]KAF6230575.1 hypothetical protein HO173_011112 [Letharia columbiana]